MAEGEWSIGRKQLTGETEVPKGQDTTVEDGDSPPKLCHSPSTQCISKLKAR